MSVYARYCWAYALARTGGAVVFDLSANCRESAAVALGAMEGSSDLGLRMKASALEEIEQLIK